MTNVRHVWSDGAGVVETHVTIYPDKKWDGAQVLALDVRQDDSGGEDPIVWLQSREHLQEFVSLLYEVADRVWPQ